MTRRLAAHIICLLLASPLTIGQGVDHNPPTWGSPSSSYCGATGGCYGVHQTVQSTNFVFSRGLQAAFYMQVLYSNKSETVDSVTGADYVSTASFYPYVDDYSQLVIPGSWPTLLQWGSSPYLGVSIQMVMLFRGEVYKSGKLAWTTFNGGFFYVPSRTLIVTLSNGKSISFFLTSSRVTSTKTAGDVNRYPGWGRIWMGEDGLCVGDVHVH
ncbi:hypothetical protein HK101_006062 [Irineochytrium annulatum]|nr:hypothetical protein HK101_006062 [Irineochytrium annulatum]